jgi:exosortase
MRELAASPVRWAVGAASFAVALPYFQHLGHESRTNPYAAHILLVPALASTLLWTQRREWPRSALAAVTRRIAVLMMSMLAMLAGYAAGSLVLQTFAFVSMVGGLMLWRYGRPGIRRGAFALGLLCLMTPPPRELMVALTPTVQRLIASASSVVLRFLGVPIEQDGVFLRLPTMTVEVAEECNGLRFLAILVVLVVAMAGLTLRSRGDRMALIAVAAPIAVLANIARVAITTGGTYFVGDFVLTGPPHFYIGKACWLVALLVCIGVAWRLRTRVDDVPLRREPMSAIVRTL